jgi:tetratricopeptide (TPR) repeat protein
MLDNLHLLDLGKAATWVRDEGDVMAASMGEKNFRRFCELILTSGVRVDAAWHDEISQMEPAALRSRMSEIASNLSHAYVAMRQHQWTDTLAALKEAIRHGARAPALINDAAYCHYQLGEIAEATSYMDRLAQAYPDNALVLRKYGIFCMETGQFEKAIASLSSARQITPGDAEILLNLAGAHAARTNMAAAWSVLSEVAPEKRRAFRRWFEQDKPYAKALRTDSRYAAWSTASTP